MLAFPLFYALQILLTGFITGFNGFLVAYVILLPLSLKIFFAWKRHFSRLLNYVAVTVKRQRNPKEYAATREKANELLLEIGRLIKQIS